MDERQAEYAQKLMNAKSEAEQAMDRFIAEYSIPEEKSNLILPKVTELRKKFPDMKHDRLLRKVAEFFKFKKK